MQYKFASVTIFLSSPIHRKPIITPVRNILAVVVEEMLTASIFLTDIMMVPVGVERGDANGSTGLSLFQFLFGTC